MALGSSCLALAAPHTSTTKLAHDLGVGLPAFLFLGFLVWRAKPSLRKLQRSNSHIMTTYYSWMWVVGLLGVVRSVMQMAEASAPHPGLYNVVWLVTRFGLVLLEVSVLVFLLQGHLISGHEALVQSLLLSGAFAAAESLLSAGLIFGAKVPLFLYGGDAQSPEGDMQWPKWSFWLLHTLLFGAVYAAMLALPFTRWRDRLPAKPSFYRYVMVLFILNCVAAAGALMLGSRFLIGYCVYGVAHWAYFALLPVLIYLTFLAEFFLDDAGLDQLYYSEMRESGYFEDDYISSY